MNDQSNEVAVPEMVPTESSEHMQTAPTRSFRAMSAADYANMDPTTKARVVRIRHMGDIQASEQRIVEILTEAMTVPRVLPDGTHRPPYRHDEIVVVLIHKDDPILPEGFAEVLEDQGIDVGIFTLERETFAAHLMQFQVEGLPGSGMPATRPYRKAGKALAAVPPPGTLYVTVFDLGMCTVTFFGFDPSNPTAESVPMDPSHPVLPSVDPLPMQPDRAPAALPT